MDYLELLYENNFYNYHHASSVKMNILSDFLTSDVIRPRSFKEWALDKESDYACLNITVLEKEDDNILLSDYFSEEKIPTVLTMTSHQFIVLLDKWEQILHLKPREVIIKYEKSEFIIETKY